PGAVTFSDHSGNGEAGICDGDACPITGIAGRSNQSVWMDGQDDRILVDVDVPDTDYAVSFWFRTKSYGDLCRGCGLFSVADDDGQDGMGYLDGGRLCAKVGSQEICGTADIADGSWHHVVHTLGADVTGQHLYVDGTLAASGTTMSVDFTGQTQLQLGQAGAAAQSHFEGALDHVVLVRDALDEADARALGKELPWASLHLDDPLGATSFGNDANAAYDGTCRVDAGAGFDGCPKAGADGWIRGAVSFDGVDDRIYLDRAVLPAGNFSVALWVKPAQRSSYTQTLVTSEGYGASVPDVGLLIDPDSTTLRYVDCQRELASAPNALLEDQWNHIVVTFNADGLVLYINGAQDRALEGPLSGCGSYLPFHLGGDSLTGWDWRGQPFAGMMDEFSIYGRALSRREVEALYDYQISWVDVSVEHRIVVDADKPTVDIVLPSPVVDMSPGRVIYIRAYDETTRVESVRYRINDGAWQAATQNDAAWLFSFSPSAEGSYTIDAQAFDSVGSRSTTASVAFDVDASSPVVAVDSATTQRVLPVRTVVESISPPSGQTAFPDARDGVYSSGGGIWFAKSRATGSRRLDADVIDRVDLHLAVENMMYEGAEAEFALSINYTEVGRFSVAFDEAEKDVSFTFDPVAKWSSDQYIIELEMLSGNNLLLPLGQSTLTFYSPDEVTTEVVDLWGSVRDRGAAGVTDVWVDLLEASGVSLGGRQPAVVTDQRWQIAYALPANTDGRYGLKLEAVDGVGNSIVRQDETLSIDGVAPGVAVTHAEDDHGLMIGIAENAPELSGIAVDVPYPVGQRLAFSFEEATGDTTFRDASGRELAATCAGAACPTAGVSGRVGGALSFSGAEALVVEDIVVDGGGAETVTAFEPGNYTIAAWFRSSAGTEQTLFAATAPSGPTQGIWLRLGSDGKLRHDYQLSGEAAVVSSTVSLADGAWHHVAAAKSGTQLKLYVDGLPIDGVALVGDWGAPLEVTIGQRAKNVDTARFVGLLDEVLVYQRALPDERIKALGQSVASGVGRLEISYRHLMGQDLYEELLAYLPMDEVAGSETFLDLGLSGEYGACVGAACPVAGAPGQFGSGLTFDGVDDVVSLGTVEFGGPLTFAAWVRPTTASGRQTLLYHGLGADYEDGNIFLRIKDGYYEFGMLNASWGDTVAQYEVPAGDIGAWVHLAGVWTEWGGWYLYRNAKWVALGDRNFRARAAYRVPMSVGALGPEGAEAFAGSMDEVAVYARGLDEYEIRALADPQRWQDLPVANPGAALTPWSTQVAGVEGPHQIDLRVTDQFGRANLVPGVWAGEFDTAAPRVSLTVNDVYDSPSMHQYWLSVEDYNARDHVSTDITGA
ncbi:MAG: LamG domain-containing protein, partial [Anaerolineae bacterium]|nr:LamG domain-containing protein [Anaerolineae bacterium]